MRRFRLKDLQGMSLTELMVVVGILGFVSLVVASSFTDIFKWQGQVVVRDEANEFAASLGRVLFSDTLCTEALMGQGLPGSPGGAVPASLAPFVGYSPTDSARLASGSTLTPLLRIGQMTIQKKGAMTKNIDLAGVRYQHHLAQVDLTLETKLQGQWKPVPKRSFEVPVLTNTSGVIQRCYLELMIPDVCEVMGSVFEPSTGRCRPQTQCFLEGNYSRTTCSPSTSSCPPNIPNSVTGGYSCPSGMSSSETGVNRWQYDETNEKKEVITISAETIYYICLRCTN